MITATRDASLSQPNARFTQEHTLEIKASAAGNCRRALWYEATGQDFTNPISDHSRTILEANNALKPVVLQAMQRAGWRINPTNPTDTKISAMRLGPTLVVTGQPDATGIGPSSDTPPSVIEVKIRGPEAYRRWQHLGAERSHPESVKQAAIHTYGTFSEARNAVIATLDTATKQWDFEVIPAERVEQAWESVRQRLEQLSAHYATKGADPESAPPREFEAGSRHCKHCPFPNACRSEDRPVTAEIPEESDPAEDPVTDQEAKEALHQYERLQDAQRKLDEDKRRIMNRLQTWLSRKGAGKAKLEGRHKTRTVGLVQSTRYTTDHKKLNFLLAPETRADIVSEKVSEYLRIS